MKPFRIVLSAIGISLLIISIILAFKNMQESKMAGEQSNEILEQVEIIPEQEPETKIEQPKTMPTDEVDGLNIIGVLQLPSLNKSLPVISSYSDEALEYGPCVYRGSYLTDDLIIAAHSYRAHFGDLAQLQLGDQVSLDTVDGKTYSYTVSGLETIAGTDVPAMLQGDWDMTLFTCTWYSTHRVTVRLSRT